MSAAVDDLARLREAVAAPAFDRPEAIKRARALLAPSLGERENTAYPVDALGPLAAPCEAISRAGQVRPAMVGQCLLGAASLLTQGLFNVQSLANPRPLSLYLLSLGDSGDGKSTAQGAALHAVTRWQRAQARTHDAAVKDYEAARTMRKKGDDAPTMPASPFRLVTDATVQGLRRELDTGPAAQGVFTDEGAAMLAGYGMSAEQSRNTAAVFNGLWDSGHLSVSRATGGRMERYGRRVALHWLIQPLAAAEALADPMLSSIGLWPRFLVAWPAPQEPRRAMPFAPEQLPDVVTYWHRCEELLAEPLGDDASDAPLIALGAGAYRLLSAGFERLERESRRGTLRPIKPFGLRATEQACRVAGVLAAFAGRREVDADTAAGALALVTHSLDTWLAIVDEGASDPAASNALRLYEWLTGRPGWRERLAVIVKDGPAPVRSRDKRDAAMSLLIETGLAELHEGTALALMPDQLEAAA
ncbi:MAG: DUF3987 domain-containing protein [Aquabacterium sp.]|nr:DUF3987 domain-containing protein [Aquabacterium sp.]